MVRGLDGFGWLDGWRVGGLEGWMGGWLEGWRVRSMKPMKPPPLLSIKQLKFNINGLTIILFITAKL